MIGFHMQAKTKNVNSDVLCKDILQTLQESASDFIRKYNVASEFYDTKQMTEFLEIYFGEMVVAKTIEQYDIICDKRNNTDVDFRKGNIHLKVTFVQMHCLNVTEIQALFHT